MAKIGEIGGRDRAAEALRHERSARAADRLDPLAGELRPLAAGADEDDRLGRVGGENPLEDDAFIGDDDGRLVAALDRAIRLDNIEQQAFDRTVGRLGQIRADDLADRLGAGRGRTVAVGAVAGKHLPSSRLIPPAANGGGERGKLVRREVRGGVAPQPQRRLADRHVGGFKERLATLEWDRA